MKENQPLPTDREELATLLLSAISNPFYPILNHPEGKLRRYFVNTINQRVRAHNSSQTKEKKIIVPYTQEDVLIILRLLLEFSSLPGAKTHHFLETGCSSAVLQELIRTFTQ